MNKVLLLTILFNLAHGYSQSIEVINSEIEKVLKTIKVPGAAVTIIRNDSILFTSCYGYRNLEENLKVDTQTIFPIGSSSKAFTGTLMGIARNKELLDFEDSPIDFIKTMSFHDEEMNRSITIKDLLSHRTGLPRHDLSWYLFPENNRDSLARRLRYLQPFSEVRAKYHYNNFTFMLLGLLAEKRLNGTWHDLVSKNIFLPLEMTSSSTKVLARNSEKASIGYLTDKEGISKPMPYYDLLAMSPAGSINSTIEDMANWVRCWLNNGKFNDKQIIPIEYFGEAISSQMVMRPNLPDDEFPDLFFSNYGYGWMLSSYKGHYRVEHGGNINGFSANVCFFPAESLGIVVLTNQNNSDAPYMIRNTISDILLHTKKTDWISYYQKEHLKTNNKHDSNSSNTKDNLVLVLPAEIIGQYRNDGYGTIVIENNKSMLTARFPIGSFPLIQTNHLVFTLKSESSKNIDPETVPELMFEFTLDNEGKTSSIEIQMEPTLEPIIFKKEKK